MLNPKIGTPLALAILVALAGCAKKEPAADAAKAPEAPAAAAQMPADHPTATPSADVDLTGITKADGGKTVAEVFAEKDALAGQPVTVRGKAVKVNAGIMGTNWVHVRDGSGADGTNDLTVTHRRHRPERRRHGARDRHRRAEQGLRHGLLVRRHRRGRHGDDRGRQRDVTGVRPVAGDPGHPTAKKKAGQMPGLFN